MYLVRHMSGTASIRTGPKRCNCTRNSAVSSGREYVDKLLFFLINWRFFLQGLCCLLEDFIFPTMGRYPIKQSCVFGMDALSSSCSIFMQCSPKCEIIIPCYPPPQCLLPQHTNAVSLGPRVLVCMLRNICLESLQENSDTKVWKTKSNSLCIILSLH